MNIERAMNYCPLCHNNAKYSHYDQFDGYYGSDMGEHTIKCIGCGIQITTNNKMETLNKWNGLWRFAK